MRRLLFLVSKVVSDSPVVRVRWLIETFFLDKPPSPPKKTGLHRYVFVLLEGDNTNLTKPEDRKRWGAPVERKGYGVREWADEEGLRVVGANFFYAKHKKQ